MTVKMTQMATATSRPEVHLPDAPCGGSPNYSGCSHVNCVDVNKWINKNIVVALGLVKNL